MKLEIEENDLWDLVIEISHLQTRAIGMIETARALQRVPNLDERLRELAAQPPPPVAPKDKDVPF